MLSTLRMRYVLTAAGVCMSSCGTGASRDLPLMGGHEALVNMEVQAKHQSERPESLRWTID